MSLGTEDNCRTHKTADIQQITGFLYWLINVWSTDTCPLETRGRRCNSFLPWAQMRGKLSRFFHLFPRQTGVFKDAVRISMGLWSCLLLLQKVIISRLPWIIQWTYLKVCQPPNGIQETFYDLQPPFQMIVHPPASSNYCHCWSISVNLCFISQNPISKWTQRRASLPIETVSSMLVAVSGTVTRATAIFSKAPVAHETSIAVGARHTWLAVAESRLGVASPASAESCVGWTHWLAGASYGDRARGDWDYVPRGHLVKWHFCKADKLVPSSLCSVVLSQNW